MDESSFRNLWEHPLYHPSESEINASLEALLGRINRYERQHAGPSASLGWNHRRWLRAAGFLLLPLLAAAFTYLWLGSRPPEKIYMANRTYSVPAGEKQDFRLPDGTRVSLNAGSVLIVPEQFVGDTRPVYLTGEAYFHVAPDPAHPFIVHTALVDVEAVGTAFCVSAYPLADAVRTTLSEGKVRLSVPSSPRVEPVLLVPDQQSYYVAGEDHIHISDVPIAPYMAWKDGQIVFDETPFAEVVHRLQLEYNVRISYAERLDSTRVTAKFICRQSLEEVLNTLQEVLYFQYKKEGGSVRIE